MPRPPLKETLHTCTCSVLDMVCYHSIHLFVCSTAEPLLILAMKVMMTVVHKMFTVLHSLLDSPQSLEGGSMIASIVGRRALLRRVMKARVIGFSNNCSTFIPIVRGCRYVEIVDVIL